MHAGESRWDAETPVRTPIVLVIAAGLLTRPVEALWRPALVHIVAVDFMMIGSGHILIPVIALYISARGGSESMVGIVASIFMFSSIILRPVAGIAVDIAGERRVLLLSIAVIALAGAVLPIGLALPGLIVIRIIQGLGWACYFPASTTLMSELIPKSRRGEGIGYVSMVRNIGVAVGSVVGLFLVERGHFDLAFVAAAFLVVVALGIAWRFRWTQDRSPGPHNWSVRALIESRAVNPAVVSAAMTFVMGAMMTFVPLDALGRDIGSAAAFFLVYSMVLMVMRPLSGRLSDRLHSRGVLIVPGLVLTVLSAWVLAFTEHPLTLWIAALLWGAGFGTAQPVLRAMVLDRTPRHRWGAANATSMVLYDLGFALGPLILGAVASRTGIATMFALASVAPLLAIVLVLRTGLHRESSDQAGI